jgi:hypothetical protein
MFAIACPHCKAVLRAPEGLAGKACLCNRCRKPFRVGLASAPASKSFLSLRRVHVLALAIGLVLLCSLLVVAVLLLSPATRDLKTGGPSSALSAKELHDAPWQDLDGARALYVGKVLYLEGAVAVARERPDDGSPPFVLLDQGPNAADDSHCVICRFVAADRDVVASLRKDQRITIRGRCVEERVNPQASPFFSLAECQVIGQTAEVPAAAKKPEPIVATDTTPPSDATGTSPRSGGAGVAGGDKSVHVRGYTDKNGRYVAPHDRAAPGAGSRRR